MAEYVRTNNVEQSALAAGFSPSYAKTRAYALIRGPASNPRIVEAIEKMRQQIILESGVAVHDIVRELSKLAFSNMADFVSVTSDGDPMVNLSEVDRDKWAALQEVTTEDYVEGRGPDARDVKRVKVKLADKRAALVDIGKYLGMFRSEEGNARAAASAVVININMRAEDKDL